jgi:BMFP domain-containing protein YqiC
MFENKFDPRQLDELTRSVMSKLPSGLQDVQRDVEKNLRAALQSGLARLDLVTREEFEVQSAVLQRSREKLEALERRVTELEAQAARD